MDPLILKTWLFLLEFFCGGAESSLIQKRNKIPNSIPGVNKIDTIRHLTIQQTVIEKNSLGFKCKAN